MTEEIQCCHLPCEQKLFKQQSTPPHLCHYLSTLSCGLIGWLLLIFLNVNIGVLWGPTVGSFLFPVFSYFFDFLYDFQILSHIACNLPICIFSHNSPNAHHIESLTSHFIPPCRVQDPDPTHLAVFPITLPQVKSSSPRTQQQYIPTSGPWLTFIHSIHHHVTHLIEK